MGDMTAGLYGHSHPVIAETIMSTVTEIGMSIGATTTAEARLAEALCDRFASIEQVRFCNSGTEANLYALSVARHVTGRSKVIVFEGAYHGGLLSFAHGVAPNNVDKDDWIIAQYNDPDGVKRLISDKKDFLAAVIVEGMQGAGGCIPGTLEFLYAIQTAAKENGVLFILDEVITSRLAPGGIQWSLGLSPDLTTLGKWIGGGLAIGAFGGRRDLMAIYDPRTSNIHHSGTFNNNSLAINVGHKAITTVYTAEACIALNELGEELRSELQELFSGTKMVVHVTGIGAVMNVHFLPARPQTKIGSIRDLSIESDSVEAALRDLFWFYLLERGIWIARRGMISLILGTTELEIAHLKAVIIDFIDEYRGLLVAM
ncbi:pyridoxal phosphate-dependent transferase [Aspergillus stella-maris]|uniref:pyridoxal phosphate-dependent transferase n=1 Tax=Aspergillus stella-maris TaxID=1810926 RepID=UPI003CCE4538